MKYVFVSKRGDILPLAQRLEDEGNQIDFYVCQDENLIVDKHIIDNAPDIIVFDSHGFGKLANRLTRNGFAVLGCSLFTDQLESDERYGIKVLQLCGLPTLGNIGIPVTIDAWFNGKHFINHMYCLDNVVCPGSHQDKLFTQYVSKLASALKKAEYKGPITLEATIGKDGVSFKNFRAQFAAPSMLVFKEALKGRVSHVFSALAQGQDRTFMFKPGYSTSVTLSFSPSNLFSTNDYCEIVAEGLTDDTLKHLWLYGFTRKAGDKFVYRGTGGRVAVVTARGDTIREARRRAYRTVFNIKIPDVLFLQKVGKNATAGYGNIKQWGWIQ